MSPQRSDATPRRPMATWAAMLACPLCGGPLDEAGNGLCCPADRADYPIHAAGLLDLRPPGRRAGWDAFAQDYRAARLAEGWSPLSAALAQALPFADPPGFPRLYWPLRRASWKRLAQLLAALGPAPLTIADAGAGFPWLSHRLAGLGHAVVAFDVSGDADFGLGAARHFATAAMSCQEARSNSGGCARQGGSCRPWATWRSRPWRRPRLPQ
ncbi:MAG: Trm112 family protein [Anaerolineae bacterium]